MNREELLELAARMERAEGADRALDVLIGCAVRYVPELPGCDWARGEHWRYAPVPRNTGRIGCADKAGNVAAHWEAPSYTASLDAALGLIPNGHVQPSDIVREALKRLAEKFNLHMMHWPLATPYAEYLARFVTAASLRALASQEKNNG